MVHVLAGSLGVSTIVLASAELSAVLKLAGGAYLVWYGLRTVIAAVLAGGAAPAVGARPGLVRRLRAASGAAMVALGLGLAFARRSAT